MQLAAGVGAQTNYIARVRRNLGLKQDDMKYLIGLVVLPAEVPAANRELSSV